MSIRGVHGPTGSSSWFGVPLLAAAAAAAAGALVVREPAVAAAVVGVVVIVAYLGETARRPLGEVLIVGVVALAGCVDMLQRIDAGPASGQAAETVVLVILALLVCITGVAVPAGAAGRALGLVTVFVMWSLVSFSWGTASTQGFQNTLVFVAAILFMAIAATVAHHRGKIAYEAVSKAFWVAAAVGLSLYAAGVAIAGPGTDKILAPRPFGLMGVVLVAWFLGAGLVGRRWAYWVVAAAVVLTLLSLSRSAFAAQLVLVALAWFDLRNFRGWLTAVGAGIVVLALAISAVFLYAPLHHRFFHGDTAQIGGFSLNVTGRDALWSANWGWFKERPLIGHGAGASDRLTETLPDRGAGHPHNDYLRILVDYGIVGFVLWITAYLALLRLTWKRWQAVRGTRVWTEHVHAAAFLVLVGIALTMIVDNPMIELARMAPLGVLVGMSLALPAPAPAAEDGAAPAPIPAMAAR
jgi:O-antigen ligase